MSGFIPPAFIDQLLARVDIIDVIDSRVPLTKKGANYSSCCPFHNEKTPSFSVTQSKQFYHCFGCGVSGTAITFLMEYEHLSFPAAVEELALSVGMEVPRDNSPQALKKQQYTASLHSVLELAYKHYQLELKKSAPAKEYLQQRGISQAAAEKFGLGFAPAGWDFLLKVIGTDPKHRELLAEAGMLSSNEQRQYDRFRERLMFPIHDSRGRIIAFGGRVLASGEPKYLNSPETPLFHKGRELYGLYQAQASAAKLDSILVVEGYMDVVMLATHGIDNAVATLGTACSSTHVERLLRVCKQVIFCFDGDNAGRQAAWRALENSLAALNDEVQLSFMFLPQGEDPDSLVKRIGAEAFRAECTKAVALGTYLIDKLQQNFPTDSIDGISNLVAAATPLINKIKAPIYANLLKENIAKLAKTSAQVLFAENNPANLPAKTAPAPARDYRQQNINIEHNLKRKIIGALIWQPSLALSICDDDLDLIDTIADEGVAFIIDLFDLLRDLPELNSAAILSRYANTKFAKPLENIVNSQMQLGEPDPSILAQEFQDAIAKLCARATTQKFLELTNRPSTTLSAQEIAFIKSYRSL